MNKCGKIFLNPILWTCFLHLPCFAFASEKADARGDDLPAFDPGFVSFLIQNGEWDLALRELPDSLPAERYASHYYELKGLAHSFSGNHLQAAGLFRKGRKAFLPQETGFAFAVKESSELLKLDSTASLWSLYEQLPLSGSKDDEYFRKFSELKLILLLREGKTDAAKPVINNLSDEGKESSYRMIIDSYREENPRSPALAGILSGIVPGSGKMYNGQLWDGLQSLSLVSVTSILAWQSFAKGGMDSVPAWMFSGLAVTFYAGNIYGSVIGARLENKKHKNALNHALQQKISDWSDH